MWIVTINKTRHSAWKTLEQAEEQIVVLYNNGYKKLDFYFDPTVSYENGYYYV